ncbi:TraG-like protein, N-terminal region [Serratia fonticola]|jgi:hypothetical protein|nr:TraG-like protein, N-terminal region [Serratia fonticola]CAI1748553.1 TraG-like protein, N-terminal region [Serratia fonticola]CAI1781641.1 TraG-like protein, N-terminal region [Serratia fonticola]
MFTLTFATFWWELGNWMDDRLIEIVYTDAFGYYNWFSHVGAEGWIMNLVLGSMFVVLPMFWFGAVSWSGFQIGGAISQSVNKAGSGSQDEGAQGGKIAVDAAKSVATKGAKKWNFSKLRRW